MTTIQEVLFELKTDYYGHPYYVSGHALYTAISRRLEDGAGHRLSVSNGVFLPGEYGKIAGSGGPTESLYSTSLEPVETYDDLFRFRDSAQRWLLDSRPRDAHNALGYRTQGGRVTVAPTCLFGRPPENHYTKRSVTWYVHCYLHDDGSGVVPLDESVLDGLRVGGARNYGLGELGVADSQRINLDDLDYSRLHSCDDSGDGDHYNIELLSPYVLRTPHPNAENQSVPWWWDSPHELRRRQERLVVGEDVFELETIDHGQRVRFAGSDPVKTAKNGVLRIGSHSKFGLGEFRLRPASDDRVTWCDPPNTVARSSNRPVDASRPEESETA